MRGEVVRRGGRTQKDLIEPPGVNIGTEKIGFGKDAAKECGVGLDSRDGVFPEGAAETGDGFLAAVAPSDQLRKEGVVIPRDSPAGIHAFIEPPPGAVRAARKNFPG